MKHQSLQFIKFAALVLSLSLLGSVANADDIVNEVKLNDGDRIIAKSIEDAKQRANIAKSINYAKQKELASTSNVNDAKQDPLEKLNRKIYKFNQVIDVLYIKPISTMYRKAPAPVKRSVSNFLANLGEIPNTANHVVQGKFKNATSNFMRLLVNSTFGLCGLFDVATHMGFSRHTTNLGCTLMKLGYKKSAYLVLPIIGPSTVRDGVGIMGNAFVSSPYYFKPKWRNRYLVTAIVHNRSELQEVVDIFEVAGVDEYVTTRDAYLQRMQYLNNGKVVLASDELLKGPPE